MANLNYFLWLSTRRGFRPGEIWGLLRYFGTPERIYFAEREEYDLLPLSPAKKAALLDKDLTGAEKIQADCDRLSVRIMTIQDADYPERLAQIDDPPCVLYLKGRPLKVDGALTIGVVGTRSCTPYGVDMAGRLGLELARSGAVLVSGIAEGIDAAALKGALQGGGTLISVVGGGTDMPFPPEHRWLYADVAAAGTLVSEYPPGTTNDGWHFPIRNRIISGLSMGVAVVEAGERSGALITARLALDQDREVFAVPGAANAPASLGCDRLIQRGEAKLILSAVDILEEFVPLFPDRVEILEPMEDTEAAQRLDAVPMAVQEGRRRQKVRKKEPQGEKEVDNGPQRAYISLSDAPETFTDDERDVLLALGERDLTADEITEAAQIPARRVLSALTMLQVRSRVEERLGKRFRSLVTLGP